MMYLENIKELTDTVDLMLSDSYDDRLKAEFMQLKIRSEKLKKELDNTGLNVVGQRDLMRCQLEAMQSYKYLLIKRCELAGIDLRTVME